MPTEADGEFILKPIPSTPGLEFQSDVPANEHLTMQVAAQAMGIKVPPNGIMFFPDGSAAYIVKRFDREPGTGAKLPQEDFCQLSGRTQKSHGKNFKYDGSYEEMGRILKHYCSSAVIEIEKLFRLIVFNYAVGNGDAHFKNFSLGLTPMGDYALSPAYDLLNTNLHLPNESRSALDLFDGDFETEAFRRNGFYTSEDFRELARRFGIQARRAGRIIDQACHLQEAAHVLLDVSFLSEAARIKYGEILADRIQAMKMGV